MTAAAAPVVSPAVHQWEVPVDLALVWADLACVGRAWVAREWAAACGDREWGRPVADPALAVADPALATADPARVDLRVIAMATERGEDRQVAVALRDVLKDDPKGARAAVIVVDPKVDLVTVTAVATVDRIVDLRVIAAVTVTVTKMIRSRFVGLT